MTDRTEGRHWVASAHFGNRDVAEVFKAHIYRDLRPWISVYSDSKTASLETIAPDRDGGPWRVDIWKRGRPFGHMRRLMITEWIRGYCAALLYYRG